MHLLPLSLSNNFSGLAQSSLEECQKHDKLPNTQYTYFYTSYFNTHEIMVCLTTGNEIPLESRSTNEGGGIPQPQLSFLSALLSASNLFIDTLCHNSWTLTKTDGQQMVWHMKLISWKDLDPKQRKRCSLKSCTPLPLFCPPTFSLLPPSASFDLCHV